MAQRRHDDELLAFWEEHTPQAFHGLLTRQGWTWDAATQSYVSETGTRVRQDGIRNIALAFILSCEIQYEQDTQYVSPSEDTSEQVIPASPVKIDAWRRQMQENLENEFLLLAALAAGGLDEVADEDYAILAGQVTTETTLGSGLADATDRLNEFATELNEQSAGSAKQISNRAGMYAGGGYGVYQEVRRNSHIRASAAARGAVSEVGASGGLALWERNLLDPLSHHCHADAYAVGCTDCTDVGWVLAGTLPAPGMRACFANCHCDMQYVLAPRNADPDSLPGGENDQGEFSFSA